jgi:hypothetical protein
MISNSGSKSVATSIITSNKENALTPECLYGLLPLGTFNIQFVFEQIRDYSPHQRFPKPRYDLYEVLSAWYQLTRENKVTILNGSTAEKISRSQLLIS